MNHNIFIECFSTLKDKRKDRTKLHSLLDIVALVLFAIMSGAQTFEEIELFGKIHAQWLKQYLLLPNGIPSHDTIRRVLGFLDHQELIAGFIKWVSLIKGLIEENVVPIDGKTMRSSHKKCKGLKALHVLSAYSCANGLSLGQLKVDGKTNEITVIPDLVKQLFIDGAIVTIDAMGCQKNIAKAIIDQKADYLLAVKDNQKQLHEAITDSFKLSEKNNHSMQTSKDDIEANHGKIEERITMTLPASTISHMIDLEDWANIKSIVKIIRTAEDSKRNITTDTRYFISSVTHTDPKKIATSARLHWNIENHVHWTLDVVFKEDDCRIRDEIAALNFAWFRKMALSFLKPILPFGVKVNSIRKKMFYNWAKPECITEYINLQSL